MKQGPFGTHCEDSEGVFVLVGGYTGLLHGEVTKYLRKRAPLELGVALLEVRVSVADDAILITL